MSDLGVAAAVDILKERRSAVVLELGACDGDTTLSILRRLEPGCVERWYAWEADPRNVIKLRRNLENNRAELGARIAPVAVVPVAVSDYAGQLTMRLSGRVDGAEWTGSSTICEPLPQFADAFPWMTLSGAAVVPCMDLDTFCQMHGVGHVDLIWCDVEGAERQVIEGGRDTLARTDWLFVEVWERPLFDGQWLSGDVLAALPGWELKARIENNLLLHRRGL
jgi:2-O-methyltransferase